MNLAAVVVLFNPDSQCLQRILEWSLHCQYLCVVDNSPIQWSALDDLRQKHPSVNYIHSGQNFGIATALNLGISKLLTFQCDWIITMDQDSKPSATMPMELLRYAQAEADFERFAIISPLHLIHPKEAEKSSAIVQRKLTVMTSGNLLRVKAWQDLDGFDEDLFIDGVDDDFCLRAHLRGWIVVQVNAVEMDHPLGALEHRRLAQRNYYPSFHSPIRRYYITRNRLYLSFKYGTRFPDFRAMQLGNILRETMLILCFEDLKWAKICATVRGIWHWMIGRRGQLLN